MNNKSELGIESNRSTCAVCGGELNQGALACLHCGRYQEFWRRLIPANLEHVVSVLLLLVSVFTLLKSKEQLRLAEQTHEKAVEALESARDANDIAKRGMRNAVLVYLFQKHATLLDDSSIESQRKQFEEMLRRDASQLEFFSADDLKVLFGDD